MATKQSSFGAQGFPWGVYYKSQGSSLQENLDEALAQTADAGLTTWENLGLPPAEEADAFATRCRKQGLTIPTIYENVRLHEPATAQANVTETLQRITALVAHGLEYLVVNPEPVSWKTEETKSDDALRLQASMLEALGRACGALGVKVAYHIHAPEMREGAREFHHMLLATSPEHVGFCLDAQWIHRGAGLSMVAVEDAIRLYRDRIITLHLRQSLDGIWTEHLMEGDLDFRWIADQLREVDFHGPIIFEAAAEKGTPQTMSMQASLEKSLAWAHDVFVGF